MFEWHGWATIVASPAVDDDAEAEARERAVEAEVTQFITDAEVFVNETVDLRYANGGLHLWLAGSHNRRNDAPIDLFRTVAEIAPGSYGVLYAADIEVNGTWERWVMRRGSITCEADTSLSPHFGKVEDPWIP